MTSDTPTRPVDPSPAEPISAPHDDPPRMSLVNRLGLIRFSGFYGLVALVVLFGATQPELFLTETNLKVILVNSAITGLLAVGVLVPMAAGALDLSFGSLAGLSMVFIAWTSTRTDADTFLVALGGILLAGLLGLTSGLLVAYVKLDSFIVTLGMSSVALGITEYLTGGNTLTANLSESFVSMGLDSLGPIPILAVVLLVVATGVYVWMEHTPSGRFVLASGNNPNAARLAGINVPRIQVAALVFSGLVAGLAGALMIARVGSATDTGAQGYLLPVVAALFLGSTQVLPRPNVLGTILAVYLLGTGVQGIQLHGNQPWVSELFNGIVVLAAICVAQLRQRTGRRPRRVRTVTQAA